MTATAQRVVRTGEKAQIILLANSTFLSDAAPFSICVLSFFCVYQLPTAKATPLPQPLICRDIQAVKAQQ